jgi:hypothetical protein
MMNDEGARTDELLRAPEGAAKSRNRARPERFLLAHGQPSCLPRGQALVEMTAAGRAL